MSGAYTMNLCDNGVTVAVVDIRRVTHDRVLAGLGEVDFFRPHLRDMRVDS